MADQTAGNQRSGTGGAGNTSGAGGAGMGPGGFDPGAGGFGPGAGGAGDMGDFTGGGFPAGAQEPEDNTPANYQIGGLLPKIITYKIPAHSLQFDEQIFLHLLAGSISLSKDEKKRIIESVPKLRQTQVDELMRIFEEERRKFAELSTKHVDQLKKLEQQHFAEWQDLEVEQKASERKNQDQAQADEIRKKLGL